ncbi:MAG: hypothetical protein MUC60_05420 [Oscillatoria sp. Prado101]|jgi:hypothetical protein|nr:hypothetical protein [Oscillatoria sp. Prado101]
MSKIVAQPGQRIKLTYESRDFEVIVIDPNGLGQGQPTVGLGLRMIQKYVGINSNTLSNWASEGDGEYSLKLPCGKTFTGKPVLVSGNTLSALEIADVCRLARYIVQVPGRLQKSTLAKVQAFVSNVVPEKLYQLLCKQHGFTCNPSAIANHCKLEMMEAVIKNAALKSPEKEVVQRLKEREGGETEVPTPVGDIDLLTATDVVEVKTVRCWKAAAGQALMYQNYFPSHSPRLHLYGIATHAFRVLVELNCQKRGIRVTWENY